MTSKVNFDCSLNSLKQTFNPLGYIQETQEKPKFLVMDQYAFDLVYGDGSIPGHIKPENFLPIQSPYNQPQYILFPTHKKEEQQNVSNQSQGQSQPSQNQIKLKAQDISVNNPENSPLTINSQMPSHFNQVAVVNQSQNKNQLDNDQQLIIRQQNDPASNLLKYRNPHLETPSRVIVYPQTFYYNRIGQAVRPYAFADIKFGRPFLFESSKQFRETYNLGIPLGSGSTACVRRCENRERSNSKCAKMVNIDCARDVLNEINILKKLYHPQVVDIYEVLEEPKKYYIILEICIGGDIQQGLQSRPSYNEEEAAHIIQGVLIALSYCHRKGIVHRNIKPGNIMFKNSSSKMPKLIDFGSAADLTREKLPLSKIVGQLAYMAPEVLEENYTEKADIWATGVVMYELLSNKVPFDASTDQDVMMAIRDGSFAFDGPAWRSVSAEAKDLIRQMLLYNPKSRISAKDALRHPWILTQAPLQPDNKSINEHLGNMIDCKISNKLQEAILSMICHRINRDEYSSLEHTFLCLDTDYDGLINFEEFKAGFQKFYRDPFADVIHTSNSKVMALKNETQVPSFQDYCMQDDDDLQLSQIDNQRKQLDHALIFARCDLDDDGFLNWHDFLLTACNKRRSLSKYNLDEAFYSFDSYQKNFVTYDDLECAYGKFEDKGVNVWEDIIKEGLNQLRQRGTFNGTNNEDVDDGLISQEQFYRIMSQMLEP